MNGITQPEADTKTVVLGANTPPFRGHVTARAEEVLQAIPAIAPNIPTGTACALAR